MTLSVDEIIRLATELPDKGVTKVVVGDVTLEFGPQKAAFPFEVDWDKELKEVPEPTDEDLKFHSAGY